MSKTSKMPIHHGVKVNAFWTDVVPILPDLALFGILGDFSGYFFQKSALCNQLIIRR